jgi:hypothetical protein
MSDAWSSYTVAGELLELLPALGRIMFTRAKMM